LEANRELSTKPLLWLQHYTRTRDDHWKEKHTAPYARFPDKPYFPRLFELMASETHLFLPKSREMMLSWALIGYAVHLCQWTPNTQVIVQSEQEKKSVDLVVGRGKPGYARVLWEQQDEFLKRLHPLTKDIGKMPEDLLSWENNSTIQAVPSGPEQFRQPHPALVILDEAAFLTGAAASYDAALPVASQIIVVSSAGPSWMGEIVSNILNAH